MVPLLSFVSEIGIGVADSHMLDQQLIVAELPVAWWKTLFSLWQHFLSRSVELECDPLSLLVSLGVLSDPLKLVGEAFLVLEDGESRSDVCSILCTLSEIEFLSP
jgi:hypothetical protein